MYKIMYININTACINKKNGLLQLGLTLQDHLKCTATVQRQISTRTIHKNCKISIINSRINEWHSLIQGRYKLVLEDNCVNLLRTSQ